MPDPIAQVSELDRFDTVIDTRSPAEFEADHIPGAINLPVLSNEERAIVGTMYTQVSTFEARKVGGAMVARNIARHLDETLRDRPKGWRPLIYCWRGGQRSGSFTAWLRMVGWDARQLDGGYKRWRRHVIGQLDSLPAGLDLRVIAGPTGSGKTRVLQALQGLGAQVLDLEALAAHKGSVLGDLPDQPQPSQKWFDSQLAVQMANLRLDQPVFVEAESRKIGRVQVPLALTERMRASPCLVIDASLDARVDFLLRDYRYLADQPAELQRKLAVLSELHPRERIAGWLAQAAHGHDLEQLAALFSSLVEHHYDPAYRRSQRSTFLRYDSAIALPIAWLDEAGFRGAAEQALALSPPGLPLVESHANKAQALP
jgi:tRNA 2-selenouridine synthase